VLTELVLSRVAIKDILEGRKWLSVNQHRAKEQIPFKWPFPKEQAAVSTGEGME
jgi:hypothetical protein